MKLKSQTPMTQSVSRYQRGLGYAVGLLALLVSLPLIGAEHEHDREHGHDERRSPATPAPAPRAPAPVIVDRSAHGSVRHADTQVIRHPADVRHEPEHRVEEHHEGEHHVEVRPEIHHEVVPRREFYGHRDVDVDVHHRHFWDDFAFGRRLPSLPPGFISLQLGGVPYYYDNGIYYEPAAGGYQEVYPPVGAVIPQPPEGAIPIEAGGVTYFYAGGAFYLQQPDGSFAIAPTPLGVVVPELPPGTIQVSVNGTIAYQFNGIYYQPVFVNGVTQYQTFRP
jgi:hypothetical protein